MRDWLRSYGLLLRWNLLRMRWLLPLYFVVQAGISIGIVIGFAFLIPHIDPATALYLSTGAPTLGLITIGMVMAPQIVAQSKAEGFFDYNKAMPVPRLAMLAADATVWIGTAVPGLVAALVVADLRFDLALHISPLVVPAFLLVALAAVGIGYGIAYAFRPEVTGLITQMLVFFTLMFSPINFPAERLPGWLAGVHRVLPFEAMARLVRETLAVPPGGIALGPWLMLLAWGAAGLTVTARVMLRRA